MTHCAPEASPDATPDATPDAAADATHDAATDAARDARATRRGERRNIAAALMAACLFGATTPAVQVLAVGVGRHAVAACLYGGSGLLALLVLAVKRARMQKAAPLPRTAWPRFVGAVLAGGVVAPLCLVSGLRAVDAASASLLLQLEGVLTAALAWLVFRENVDRRVLLGMAAIVVGGGVLAVDTDAGVRVSFGALWLAAASLAWALDNNLSQAASSADPFVVTALKGAVACGVHVALACALGQRVPPAAALGGLLLTGALGYGVSLALFTRAQQGLGTARTGAYFSAAPFVGVAVSVVALGAPLTPQLAVAGLLMALGLWLHVSERHEHPHTHEALEHEHEHRHGDGDVHHDHVHGDGDAFVGTHTHRHRHTPLLHTHPHTPDLHHRHH